MYHLAFREAVLRVYAYTGSTGSTLMSICLAVWSINADRPDTKLSSVTLPSSSVTDSAYERASSILASRRAASCRDQESTSNLMMS